MLKISYSLFTPKRHHANRDYDSSNGASDRYWFNIPALVIANSIFYPEAETVIHVNKDITSHHLAPFLERVASKTSKLKLCFLDYGYSNTEPTLWRLRPLWTEDCDSLCRDIDSLPNEVEYRATRAFLDSHYIIHNIRSHPNHNSHLTRILAGLCAFKKECRPHIVHSYDQFYSMGSSSWGCDQSLLMSYWIDRVGVDFVKRFFLDTPISCIGAMEEVIYGFDAGKLPKESYDAVDVSHIENLSLFNHATSWCGQPIDARGELLRKLIAMNTEVARAVSESLSSSDKAFYGVG
jgi:hypothetical protein